MTETATATAPEPTTTAPPAAPPETTAPAPEATTTAAAPEAEPKPKTPWYQSRIDQLTREKWESRREADRIKAENEELRRRTAQPAADGTPAQQPTMSAEDIERLAEARASELARQNEFNRRCNDVYQKGKSEDENFDAALSGFQMLGGLNQHQAFLDACTQIPEGHKVLAHLGRNLDDAARILQLPPMQQALELARLSGELKTKPIKTVSDAPPPAKPINGSATTEPEGPDENGKFRSQEAYREWRKRQFGKH